MARKSASFLMLFLVTACPVVCGASLSATPPCKGDAEQSSSAPSDPCCPNEDRGPSTPKEPCSNSNCFCSPFVMHDTSGSTTILHELNDCPALILPDELFSVLGFLPICPSWGNVVFPPGMAETSAALPLLI